MPMPRREKEIEIETKMLQFQLMVVQNTHHDISWFDPKRHSLESLVSYIEQKDYEESPEGRKEEETRDWDLW